MSITPRTDARELAISIQNEDSCCAIYVKVYGKEYEGGLVDTDFARELERENAELRKDKARLVFVIRTMYPSQFAEIIKWRKLEDSLAAIDAAMEEAK